MIGCYPVLQLREIFFRLSANFQAAIWALALAFIIMAVPADELTPLGSAKLISIHLTEGDSYENFAAAEFNSDA